MTEPARPISSGGAATGDDGALADEIVAATRSCPAVADLSGGLLGEVASYLPGRRVVGVRVHDTDVEVHVVGRYGTTVGEIADQVRSAVTPLVGSRAIHVAVDDLADPAPTAGGG